MSKPICKYGSSCYRKNPVHLEQFLHPVREVDNKRKDYDDNSSNVEKKAKTSGSSLSTTRVKIIDSMIKECHGFFLSHIENVPTICHSIKLSDILHEANGNLIESIHFNFMFDFDW